MPTRSPRSGKRARAGQSVRVIDIPADAGQGLGIFDTLHGFASGAALADHLRRSGEAHSGHAARAFLEQITDDPAATAEAVREYVTNWLTATLPPQADGQVGRVAARFALVAAAGELATALDILPWPAGEASAAAARCFNDWLAARGDNGPEEITAGLRQVRAFLELHGTSRFEEAWPKDTRNKADITPETETDDPADHQPGRVPAPGERRQGRELGILRPARSVARRGLRRLRCRQHRQGHDRERVDGRRRRKAPHARDPRARRRQDSGSIASAAASSREATHERRRLHRALAQLRELSPPVTTTEAGGGDSSAGGESQSLQGFGETVTTVPTVTTEFVARSKISTCGHERSAFDGSTSKTVGTGGDGGDSQEPRGFPLSPPPESPVGTVGTTAPAWTDDRGWIAEILRAEPGDAKLAVLFWWVISAGGWIEGTTAKLPPLPACMASVELPRMLRQHGIAIHTSARTSGPPTRNYPLSTYASRSRLAQAPTVQPSCSNLRALPPRHASATRRGPKAVAITDQLGPWSRAHCRRPGPTKNRERVG